MAHSEQARIAEILLRQKGRARFLEYSRFRAQQTRSIARQIAGTIGLSSVSKVIELKPKRYSDGTTDAVCEVQFQWYVGPRKINGTPNVEGIPLTR